MNPLLTYRPKSPGTNIGGYRYFFNGQEGDNEVFGETANFGYEFRQYDSRLGRWWSIDPKWSKYPSVSPFVLCKGNPIMMVDLKGEDASETSSLWTGTEKKHKLDLTLDFQPFISLTDPPNVGNMQRLKVKISDIFHGLDMAIANPYSPDPFEGHGDAWEREFAKKSEPYVMGGVMLIPTVGVPNAFKTIVTGKDIYGVDASQMDRGTSWISLGLTTASAAMPELNVVNWTYTIATSARASIMYKEHEKNEEIQSKH